MLISVAPLLQRTISIQNVYIIRKLRNQEKNDFLAFFFMFLGENKPSSPKTRKSGQSGFDAAVGGMTISCRKIAV
jgi:hypothetical protein